VGVLLEFSAVTHLRLTTSSQLANDPTFSVEALQLLLVCSDVNHTHLLFAIVTITRHSQNSRSNTKITALSLFLAVSILRQDKTCCQAGSPSTKANNFRDSSVRLHCERDVEKHFGEREQTALYDWEYS
jgi:hypothetical protein